MKRGRQNLSLLVITDHIGDEVTNGSQVFSSALVAQLARWFELTVVTYQAVRPPEILAGRLLIVPPDEQEEGVSNWLARTLAPHSFSLIYNLGGTEASCYLSYCAANLLRHAPLVNHFQIMLNEYARHEGWSEDRISELGQAQQLVAEQAHLNIFPSFAELSYAHAAGWAFENARNCVVPNAFVESGVRAALSSEPSCTFLAAGRLADYVKGADLLYRAFGEVHKRHPSVRLEIASGDRRFLELLHDLPDDSWKFHGWLNRKDLHAAMSRADAVVVPSRYEPFGLVAIEAMAMRSPVIAMAVGGLAEIVQHERTGWLCPPREGSLGLRLAMERVVSDRQLARKMGINAQQEVKQNYLLSRVARLVRNHLDSVLGADGMWSMRDSLARSDKEGAHYARRTA
jgi:glycosyltransferase involved in cell wall biosynthesis